MGTQRSIEIVADGFPEEVSLQCVLRERESERQTQVSRCSRPRGPRVQKAGDGWTPGAMGRKPARAKGDPRYGVKDATATRSWVGLGRL